MKDVNKMIVIQSVIDKKKNCYTTSKVLNTPESKIQNLVQK